MSTAKAQKPAAKPMAKIHASGSTLNESNAVLHYYCHQGCPSNSDLKASAAKRQNAVIWDTLANEFSFLINCFAVFFLVSRGPGFIFNIFFGFSLFVDLCGWITAFDGRTYLPLLPRSQFVRCLSGARRAFAIRKVGAGSSDWVGDKSGVESILVV